MILLDGKTLAQKVLSDLSSEIRNLKLEIRLDIILVGRDESSLKYVSLKQQRAIEVGIGGKLWQLSSDTSESEIINLINKLNSDSSITGFFIQLPLPSQINKNLILNSINPNKDADGLVENSSTTPAVVRGIIQLLDKYKLTFIGKNVVIANDSQLIGQPLKKHFENRHSSVILCNKFTQNLGNITKTANLLISATGVKNIVTADMVKENAVVIDISSGDVDFENVSPKCSYITPTFGGVGPMTVASLLQNTVDLLINK